MVIVNNPTTRPDHRDPEGLGIFHKTSAVRGVVLLDEAYIDLWRIPLPCGTDYLASTKTFWWFALFPKPTPAGWRIGYGLTSPELADYLNRVRQPFNVNSLAWRRLGALEDDSFYQRTRRLILRAEEAEGELNVWVAGCPLANQLILIEFSGGPILYETCFARA